MRKIIRETDKKNKIVQVTVADERWYVREAKDEVTGLPSYAYVPSVTWVTSFYPKGVGFENWLKRNGDEAETIKRLAGEKGTKVHQAVETLTLGNQVAMDDKFTNPTTGQLEELTLEEYEAIYSFYKWFKEVNPQIAQTEMTVWNPEHNYAGTCDLIANIDGEPWIIDLKTSKEVYPSHELQVSAYKHCMQFQKPPRLAILQVGYARNKQGWKFTEVEDQFPLFLAIKQIWERETKNQAPFKRDYPLALTLVEKPKRTTKK